VTVALLEEVVVGGASTKDVVDNEAELEVEVGSGVEMGASVEVEAGVVSEVKLEVSVKKDVEVDVSVVRSVFVPPSPTHTSPISQQPSKPFEPTTQYFDKGHPPCCCGQQV